jgi:hypothetical protein
MILIAIRLRRSRRAKNSSNSLGSVTPAPPWSQIYFGLLSAFASNAGRPRQSRSQQCRTTTNTMA